MIDEPTENSDEFERSIEQRHLRSRALLGVLFASAGAAAALLGLGLLLGGVVWIWSPVLTVCLSTMGVYVLWVGIPGELARNRSPVPLRMWLPPALGLVLVATALLAWPLGVYEGIAVARSNCAALLGPDDLRGFGLLTRGAVVETESDHCSLDLFTLDGRPALLVEMEVGVTDIDPWMSDYGDHRDVEEGMGDVAQRSELTGGTVIGFLKGDVAARVQFPRNTWSHVQIVQAVEVLQERSSQEIEF